ncbi:CHAT domain-containing protein [Allopontixanthobacter sp.]|uniref:CHAT domain-containing protein n=1 Tax=Allopontixanthobacter sp. TaxID=2906452 RepID=UPI002ABB70B9|nr:CHAT domain-containing protein [Allopontixanthobacter sp.]MDZ4308634.1 CHAT domain-containing protein [Allopontixanthobacter sp.]
MLASLCAAMPVQAQQRPVLLRESFPIGDGGGILCQVQDRSVGNPAKQGIFDRSWAIVCRDSAQAVANVYAFRAAGTDPSRLVAPLRREGVDCSTGSPAPFAALPGAQRALCTIAGTSLEWSSISVKRGQTTYIAEGFAAYDAATVLALRSVIDNAVAAGTIDVASTSVSDPLSFARAQAETLKPEAALAEGYRRNLGGEYAEAAAYFETLQQRLEADSENTLNIGEFIVNRALQKSNLGEFSVADRLFAEAAGETLGDLVAERLQRNFEAIHLINQGLLGEALDRLDQPLSDGLAGVETLGAGLAITLPIAERLNDGGGAGGLLGFVDELKLSPAERAILIDAQALQLRGTVLRIGGDLAGAENAMLDSYAKAIAVRDGRVTSIARLRSQILGELALVSEARGNEGQAETYLRNALALIEAQYPERQAVSAAKARLGAFLLRRGREDEAIALYRDVIDQSVGKRNAITGFSNQLRPYFRLIAERVEGDAAFAEDFFKATQILVRPGVAETQAVLSRELSSSSTEGARLFRQSLDLGRDIERLRIRFLALGKMDQSAAMAAEQSELAAQIDRLESEQLRTQALLNDYPQYRVVAPRSLSLADFRASLKPGEAYAKMSVVGGEAFMFYADRDFAKAYRISSSEADLDFEVDMLRSSISALEGGRYVTYPFEVALARDLHRALFEPVADRLAAASHLVFEPDGALLRLPVDILVADDASVERYLARSSAPEGDPFDFTGIAWLGRDKTISTAVSAQSFVDARKAPRSRAASEYLGLGRNVPIGAVRPGATRSGIAGEDCSWNAAAWNAPIDDRELLTARKLIGAGGSLLLTGAEFTDDAIMGRTDLRDYRILHFATHGLVTPPNANCPAKPALLTSFGGAGSDGLLSFDEIFELSLDADIVILSACDTAGGASIEATRAAGVGSGGGTALDGLVRSFIGAGGRTVMASHWPAPDDYGATERLISEMFRLGRDQGVGLALRASQHRLMDDPQTSHPFYWGGFAIIGDATRPLLSDAPIAAMPVAAAAAVFAQ